MILPTGTLVGVAANRAEIIRTRPPYDGNPLRTRVPTDIVIPYSYGPNLLSIAPDISGVYGIRPAHAASGDALPWGTEVLLAWDGSVRQADPTEEPLQVLGTQRMVGADGQSIFGWRKDPAANFLLGLAIQGSTTPRFESPVGSFQDAQWFPGGEALAYGANDAVWTLRGLDVQRIVTIPPPPNDLHPYGAIVGLSADVVVFHDGSFDSWHVLSIATGQLLKLPGFVVGIGILVLFAIWEWLLQRNARMYGVAFSIDTVGDVYLIGRNLVLLTKAGTWCAANKVSRIVLGPLAGNPFLIDLDNLPEPTDLGEEIVENIEAGLNNFRNVLAALSRKA
jgi:hypothetical protein